MEAVRATGRSCQNAANAQKLALLRAYTRGYVEMPSAQPATGVERSVASRVIFCERCVAESTDETPGDISTMNGIGRKFYGSAEPCPECASVVRTLWWTFIDFPIIPLGSYRYKTSEEAVTRSRFWCRKLPAVNSSQVFKTWGLALLALPAVIVIIVILKYLNILR